MRIHFTPNTNHCIQSNQGADSMTSQTQWSKMRTKTDTNPTLSIHIIVFPPKPPQIQTKGKEVETDQGRSLKEKKRMSCHFIWLRVLTIPILREWRQVLKRGSDIP